jgi:hypothetical protein
MGKIILLITMLLIYYCTYGESVRFFTRKDLASFIMNDHDGYIKTLNKQDLRDRNCKTQSEYKLKYINNIIEFTLLQKERIRKYVHRASEFLRTFKSPFISNHIMKIPWVFARTTMLLETGHPHTRQGVIFLPENSLDRPDIDIIRTLVHEKIHVYQKMYRDRFVHSLLHNGYTIIGIMRDTTRMSNPDADDRIYRHPSGRIMMWKRGIRDLKDVLFEHPNELIAYTVAQQYFEQSESSLKTQ